MQRRDKIILQKIVSEIEIIADFLGNMSREEFLSDEKTKRAIGMTIINVGELIKNLSQEFREKFSQVSFKNAARFRDVVAHKYETLDMKDVYKTVSEDFPELKVQIIKILETE